MTEEFNLREELKVAYCLNPDVEYCGECVICKNTDKIIDEFIKKEYDLILMVKDGVINWNQFWNLKDKLTGEFKK